jgi:SOS response associated peptidase (SRAP)
MARTLEQSPLMRLLAFAGLRAKPISGNGDGNAGTRIGTQALANSPLRCHLSPMCGRYTYKLTWAEIVKLYRLTLPEEPPERLKPSYNVCPTDVMPIIRPAGNGRELVIAGWGLVPFWLKPEQLGQKP